MILTEYQALGILRHARARLETTGRALHLAVEAAGVEPVDSDVGRELHELASLRDYLKLQVDRIEAGGRRVQPRVQIDPAVPFAWGAALDRIIRELTDTLPGGLERDHVAHELRALRTDIRLTTTRLVKGA